MRKDIKNWIIIVILVGLIGWGIVDIQSSKKKPVNDNTNQAAEVGLTKGKFAPDFELTTLSGKSLKLSDFKGQKVILNFWATWCPPCRAEMPHMQDFYEANKEKGVTVIAVNLTTQERNSNAVQPFVEDEFQLTFPIPLDVDGDIGLLYQAYSIPTSYIIDTKGIIQQKITGPMSYEMMEQMINEIE